MTIDETITAIKAMPDCEMVDDVNFGQNHSVWLDSDDLKALADELTRLRENERRYEAMFARCDEDSELWFVDNSILLCSDRKWRTGGSSYFDGFGNRHYFQDGWDTALEAFEAMEDK